MKLQTAPASSFERNARLPRLDFSSSSEEEGVSELGSNRCIRPQVQASSFKLQAPKTSSPPSIPGVHDHCFVSSTTNERIDSTMELCASECGEIWVSVGKG